jgi:hypothetical protein
MKQSLMAGAASFAHLLGRSPKAAAAGASDDDKPREGESDEDFQKRKNASAADAEPVQGDDESNEDFESRHAEWEEDQKRDDETDDEHKARVTGNKARRAEASTDDDEEGDDGSDGADMRKRGARTARLRERARCCAIFSDAAAGKNPALAAAIAFGTDLPRSKAISLLRTGGLPVASAPTRTTLDQRMARVHVPALGGGDAVRPTGASSLADQIVRAAAKARGETA